MDSAYDRKFDEMKKYIPFLENMITRLESTTSSSSNPRQAQLDKIRSLRDLLCNKKKRMKMENLLKCEQVLINLYAKVEQRDTLSGVKKTPDSGFSIDTPTQKEKSDLEAVRNKLKSVAKLQEDQDTLPEILPRNEVTDVHTSGTKEPALFQRRPNQPSNQTNKDCEESKVSPPGSSSKRNYTRVLVSPESSSQRWSKSPVDKPLFSRRSPRKSPKRYSPTYYKKERKKSKDSQSRKRKDLNITLNVPEESLNSLNTKDILSRIITCSDGDVDIDTLRELRKQILGELKKTGAKDDISDLILKSYNKNNKTENIAKKKDEVEEGELSDSESEAIESIYGSLVVKEPNHTKTSTTEKESQPRKIQICLVINSDDKLDLNMPKQDATADSAELQMYEDDNKVTNNQPITTEQNNQVEVNTTVDQNKPRSEVENDISKESKETKKEIVASPSKENVISTSVENIITVLKESVSNASKENAIATPMENISAIDYMPTSKEQVITSLQGNVTTNITENDKTPFNENVTPEEPTQFKANFYKPLMETSNTEATKNESTSGNKIENPTETFISKLSDIENTLKQMESSPEIPLLHERTIEKKPPESTLSEIDILQALKNEILSDIPVPGAETNTPALHQPKIMKVASAQEILPKKRISIEKYKEKSATSAKTPRPVKDQITLKEDQIKKPSLKLTDKECERFFNVPKISFDDEDESLDEDDMDIEASDVYDDLAPKSPDHDDSRNIDLAPPVIIPVDRVKLLPATSKTDVDMRTLPILSPNSAKGPLMNNIPISTSNDLLPEKNKSDTNIDTMNVQNRPAMIDPRVRRDLNPNTSNLSPKPHTNNPERTPRHNVYAGSSTPNPVMTPNSRTYEMTSSHQSFDVDQTSRKHVYVPTMTSNDLREKERSIPKEGRSWENTELTRDRRTRWDDGSKPPANYGRCDVPATSPQPFGRLEMPMTPLPSFGRSDCPTTTNHSFGTLECPPTPSHPFGRLECPPTPSHPFGRLECPPTPSHPFGRLECPSTPSHPFGRLECPSTPSHPFGRLECPPTPSHPFGRLECPSTPNHPFGRQEGPPTPNHPFGRLDCPSTPSHPFGRNEVPSFIPNLMDCPSTPNNPFAGAEYPPAANSYFGRNEVPSNPNHTYVNSDSIQTQNRSFAFHEKPQTSSHYGRPDPSKSQYGRSDFHNPKFTKDPRLNRIPESETKSQKDEKDHGYYKDRGRYHGSSYSSQKAHGGAENYRNLERESSSSRNSNHSYYGSDQSRPRYNKDHVRRERSEGRSMSRSRENDEAHSRERRFDNDSRRHDEVGSRRDVSIGQNRSVDSRSTRASSVDKKTNLRQSEQNSLSVKSNAGRSFTIDTSVNATFQKIIDSANEMQGIVNSFDMRRQRAASVGRSFIRETSVGRTLLKDSKDSSSAGNENKREAFRRASSVGRDICRSNSDNRSFQEIKADFKACSFPAKDVSKASKSPNTKSKDNVEHSARSRKDIHERQRSEQRGREPPKSSYSPRKNYRDPRMRRQFEEKHDRHGSNISRRKSGIVYSNDNILTGSILASGYGVKNYKIPKIKRVTEEKEVITENSDAGKKDEKEKNKSKNSDKLKGKGVDKEKPVSKQSEKSKENVKKLKEVNTAVNINVKEINETPSVDELKDDSLVEGRQTRSSKKIMDTKPDIEMVAKPKKYKKVIIDSDSDNEVDKEDQDTKDESILDKEDKPNNKTETKVPVSPVKQKNSSKNLDSVDLDSSISSFGIDELEMFSENIVSDPVLDNINALIADLDDDLGTTKGDTSHNFTKEISLENMLENISSPEKDNSSQMEDESAKILEEIDNISSEKAEITSIEKDSRDRDNVPLTDSKIEQTHETKIEETSSKDIISDTNSIAISNTPTQTLTDSKIEQTHETKIKETSSKDIISDTNSIAISNTPTQSDSINIKENDSADNMSSTTRVKCSNADIDSTTELQKEAKPSADDKFKLDDQVMDVCSTPDSTINTEDAVQTTTTEDNLPGSTNEVSSTETIDLKHNSSTKESIPGFGSISSLLSMLQDKTKIKGLLEMLGDQSTETEKIKKKLEKLCEIASDDEESCDVPTNTSDQVEESELLTESAIQDHENKDFVDDKDEKILEDEQLSKDSMSTFNENDSKQGDDDVKTSDIEGDALETDSDIQNEVKPKKTSKPVKKTRASRKFKGKAKKIVTKAQKRVTRTTGLDKPKVKKPPRELTQLHEDIKEMFMRDDVLSATGIRMCRLAKLIDEKIPVSKEEQVLNETEPVVVLQKFKNATVKTGEPEKGKKKKIGPKNKLLKISKENISGSSKLDKTPISKNKPGPKSKTKQKKEADPYAFETDSLGTDTNTEKASDDGSSSSSDSESDSLASIKSIDSTEPLSDVKKKTKRKRRGWQAGVIKSKAKKKKVDPKQQQPIPTVPEPLDDLLADKILIPDLNCFTDRHYCFRKNGLVYSCRLCPYSGADIVLHYRNEHPHVEIPLSRMTPEVAKEAIEQCEEINFKAISNIPSEKYVCTFCFKEFNNNKSVLETFFWHIVSMHTGEYKQNCSKCLNVNDCPINLDIPPPPKDIKGQLIGYICKKCNFTQISLENLKTHVIIRHNDEQTAVYTINLSVMTKKGLSSLLRRSAIVQAKEERKGKNPVSDQIAAGKHENHRESIEKENEGEGRKTRTSMRKAKLASLPIQSKITFEGDDNTSELSDNISETSEATIKIEKVESEIADEMPNVEEGPTPDMNEIDRPVDEEPSNDNIEYPQFIIQRLKSGATEYFCCIDNVDPHYNSINVASLKKHLRMKHPGVWDGYCSICKDVVIHKKGRNFLDCLQHYINSHVSECEVQSNPKSEELPLVNTETAFENPHDKQIDAVQNNHRSSNKTVPSAAVGFSEEDLEAAFGSFGFSKNDMICCPKCSFVCKNEEEMKVHLEMELNKIRWRCSSCSERFQLYHEAQLHCKGHDGPSRPLDAVRDPVMRAAWVSTVIQKQTITCTEPVASDDIVDYPHFKINHTESGAKEYYCCINGNYHFKTTLLISMKKHVQTKHSEKWDGYCYLCKVIVTPQGAHHFKDCLQHYLNKHMDNFPIFEKEIVEVEPAIATPTKEAPSVDRGKSPVANTAAPIKPSINVRCLSDLIEKNIEDVIPQESENFPVIQSVVSLGASAAESRPVYPTISQPSQERGIGDENFKYEEHQAEIMSKKYYLVVEAMVTRNNLLKVFKCSGTYCSYATDSAEEALAHATTHQRLGGGDALQCSYCNSPSAGNAVDLVMHVFKSHGGCSFCCTACFYRAASSQAVAVHAARAHGLAPADGTVLRTTVAASIAPTQQKMLTRSEAVSQYSCPIMEDAKLCKFRSYTAEKLLDHLTRHTTALVFPCLLCKTRVEKPEEVLQHLKTHNMRLYQCTWCVHGADNETEMLAHFSSRHPDKLPQAYIRIITNKEGSASLRVLPLAFLNKNKVAAIEMTPTATKDNPVREAERSVEMEALIGPYMSDLTSAPAETNDAEDMDINIIQPSSIPYIETPEHELTSELAKVVPDDVPPVEPPAIETVAPEIATQEVQVSPIPVQLPAVKTEPLEAEKLPLEVVVLDSDDDEVPEVVPEVPQPPVIDLSDDESAPSSNQETTNTNENQTPTSKMIPEERLNTCPKCAQVCKNLAGLKKHLSSCVKRDDPTLLCPHCSYNGENIDNLLWHYLAEHSEKNTFDCGVCGALLATENYARKHMRRFHKESNMLIVRNEKEGSARFTVNVRPKVIEPPKERAAPKRKLSVPKADSIAIPSKRRFEPQDIGLLPINPILDHNVYCAVCEFSTKVRLNMYRHLQLHAEQQPVAHTAPVNPVPHLESNEKHFDKMVNLASSSITTRTPDKPRPDHTPAVSLLIPPEVAVRFPKYVPERTRHTCGARGCSYISVDEAMLRCHWDTLHSGSNDFHCVHCPPHQHLDTSKPLTATRIIAHLKMHDATLYACSSCIYYHFRREAVEKHISEIHKTGGLIVVREEYSAPIATPTIGSASAPTMDLKAWQCGICKFKSMLRPDIIDHCSKVHQAKMQFKCGYCPFTTSAVENVGKHQANSHAGQPEDVFYYYYREGSLADGADGTPQWVKQSQNMDVSETEIKVEVSAPAEEPEVTQPINIDLNLVKKEVDVASSASPPSMEDLCSIFGQFCEPNGIKYKCPLCSVIMEDTREGMQSHLYEELNYRKWSCGLCSYKAFHKAGLTNHMTSEHRRQYDHVMLPTDIKIEVWVTGVLDHQAAIIEKHKQNLIMQKIIVEPKPSPTTIEKPVPKDTVTSYSESDLENAFGPFGSSVGYMYSCPKCGFSCKKDSDMKNHLEMELNKIRWRCSNCPDTFQMYHEAQFHCKGHDSPSRPVEAIRDPAMRASWVSTVIQKQTKADMPQKASTSTDIPLKESITTDIPRIESTTTEIPGREATVTEIPRKEPTTTKIPLKECKTIKIPRKESTTTVIPLKESTTTEIPRRDSTTEIPRKDSTTTEIPRKVSTPTKKPARKSAVNKKAEREVTIQPNDVVLDLDTSSESEDQLYIDQPEYKNLNYPHFTIKRSQTGSTEYYCSIDDTFVHYHTNNTGSMKKHIVQRHSGLWDGYCYECKERVNSEDKKDFTDCLQHYMFKHGDKDVKTPEKAPTATPDTNIAKAKTAATEIMFQKETTGLYPDKDLETAFGVFGSPDNDMFCCPKCTFLCAKEDDMRDHLDMELNKIRWNCSNCTEKFQTYHEARFHSKGHDGPCRPIEAMRSPTMRAAWVSTAVQRQKAMIDNVSTPSDSSTSDKNLLESDNSLLVVRYEERVPTPDQVPIRRKRKATDSDDDEYLASRKQKNPNKQCPHCVYKTYNKSNLKIHILTHYNLKAYSCIYCKYNACTKRNVMRHTEQMHPDKPNTAKMTEVPADMTLPSPSGAMVVATCLICEKSMSESDATTHRHNNVKPVFAKGDIVVKCCICLTLCLDARSLQIHHDAAHPGEPINYAMYRLGFDTRETYSCAYCNNRFKYIKDYRAHHVAVHPNMPFNIASTSYVPPEEESRAVAPVAPRRCARKSTTKLPNSVARKSTTKLPYSVPRDDGYSFYGTRPPPLEQYSDVTMLMSFCNRMVPFSLKQLSEHLNIEPLVVVTDIKNSSE